MLWENDFKFTVEMMKGGKSLVTGRYQEYPASPNIMEFEMETDQSCFPEMISQIEILLEQYK